MYEEIVNNIYDAVCNNDTPPSIEAEIEERWSVFENDPSYDNALAVGAMYEIRGFFLGFEAAMALILKK